MLALHDIAHFYGPRLILKHISLEISAGVSLLIGPNGAGKTTLLSIMGGLISPTTGNISFPEDCRVAMLGHNTFLYPELSGIENLQFWAKLYDISPTPKMLEDALEQVNLAKFGQEQAGTYSRGMAQRLSLARLLLVKPDIMLLDEPGTGLDTLSLRTLHKIIEEQAGKGTTIVWVSHSLETDWPFADWIIRLENATIAHHLPAADYARQFGLGQHPQAGKDSPQVAGIQAPEESRIMGKTPAFEGTPISKEAQQNTAASPAEPREPAHG